MRELIVMKRAENAIYKVAQHRASEYFPETGEKFINELIDSCVQHLPLQINYPLCKNRTLSKHGYSCFVFKKKWIVAFKYSDREFRVYRFMWGANLK